jgi:periplasmic protein TonB
LRRTSGITAAPDASALDRLIETPSLLASLKRVVIDTLYPPKVESPVAPVPVNEMWSRNDFRNFRWFSLVVHIVVLAALILPATALNPLRSTETVVMLLKDPPLILPAWLRQDRTGGGGGGGMRTPTPPSRGVPPRGADKQVVPPMVEPKNLMPELVAEATIISPQLETLRPLNVQLGDPNGVVGPPSAGPGRGGGIGTGVGTGIGAGQGPGIGPGQGGGLGGGAYSVGGGVSDPRPIFTRQPEYSDDGRKARIQGTVELLIIVRPDGGVQFDSVRKSLGYGLDEKAIDAVRQWKFQPGRKDGQPVPVYVSVLVNFSLR